MNKKKQAQPKLFTPKNAAHQTRPGAGRASKPWSKAASTVSTRNKPVHSRVKKPRIAKPRYDLNNVEVKAFGGAGIPGFGGGMPGFGGGIPGLGGGIPGFGGFSGGGASGVASGAAGGSGGGIMSIFGKLGGLDGIISTMTKVQKVMTIIKQFGPIFKLFSSFGGIGGLLGGGQAKTASVRQIGARSPVRLKKRR